MNRILLADGSWRVDPARLVRQGTADATTAGDVVPLEVYLALPAQQRAGVGAWLAPADEPRRLADDVGALALIAVDFPAFKDGRGYSTATLLRTRYGFRGDLRAIGDVQIDQLFYLRRVGFSSFALRDGQDLGAAVVALRAFSDVYQASVDQPQPHFRRRAATAGAL